LLPDGLTLPVLVTAALLDSINPCVFGVLIFLIAFMTKVFKSAKRMLLGGLIYTAVVYIVYLIIGVGILNFTVSFGFSVAIYWIAALIAIIAGVLEMKDFFWYGKGFTLQMIPGAAERVKNYTKKITKLHKKNPSLSYLASGLLGGFVVLVELPCTGAPYLAILAILSQGNIAEGMPLLLLYNFIFILPLFFIIGVSYFGKSSKTLELWRQKHKGTMRLVTGLFLIALGLAMLYYITFV
jgi:cytochrome c biogenesis protein CcdA